MGKGMATTQRGVTSRRAAAGAGTPAGTVLLCAWCARYGRPAAAARGLAGTPGTTGTVAAVWVAVPHAQARALQRLPTTSHGMCPWCAARFAAQWDLPLAAPAVLAQDECPSGPPAATRGGDPMAVGAPGGRVGAWARLAAATFLVGSAAALAHAASLVVLGYVGSLLCLSTAWLACRDSSRR